MKKSIKILLKLIIIGLLIYIFYYGIKSFIKKDDVNNKEEVINKKEEIKKDEVKVTLVGDFLFEQPFYDAIQKGDDKDNYFSLVKDYFKKDDLTIGNMEVVIGNDSLKTSGVGYNFCAPSWVGDLVNTLSIEVLGTANNHAFDRGKEGVYSTIDYFKNNTDINIVGTKKDESQSDLLYIEKNNIKFGITAYTYGTNQRPSKDNYYLINYYKDPSTKEIYKDKLKKDIEELKNNSDVVIVIMHWGIEFRYNPSDEQKELASYLNSLGVDIILGSHSHNISPIEAIGEDHKTLVYYSMGNFVSHDDDIARTPLGQEEFDNAYQVGLLSTLNIIKENDSISIEDIKTELIVNYFDKDMRNFILVPFDKYDEYEKTHLRYNKGLTKDFIKKMYSNVINEEYRKEY